MTPQRLETLRQLLQRRQIDFTLIADQVNKPRNLSALMRNADAVGMHLIHTVVPEVGYRNYRGTASGSDRYVKCQQHDTFQSAYDRIKAQGMTLVAAHFSERAIAYRSFDYTQPCALLLGAEKFGVSERAAELADVHVVIPMLGAVQSLNVSTAAGIILAEAQHQRMVAGCYDSPSLSDDEIQRCLFEWDHRELARFCRQHELAYPPYNAEGELVDAPRWHQAVQAGQAARFDWSQEPV
ncbi:tRNA (guanosine(18)-2'-O)-methyltransferase TrmH [Pontibacter sp. JAM-7]|uniref:tRNA (guanosine(18)-2'-O)-methyltransferase TrmH n=1 Tax=Pontibacter sp. JAM-7 TaxID=3366581 RepID=UPI003AF41EC1